MTALKLGQNVGAKLVSQHRHTLFECEPCTYLFDLHYTNPPHRVLNMLVGFLTVTQFGCYCNRRATVRGYMTQLQAQECHRPRHSRCSHNCNRVHRQHPYNRIRNRVDANKFDSRRPTRPPTRWSPKGWCKRSKVGGVIGVNW
jgi:hypothetical protein